MNNHLSFILLMLSLLFFFFFSSFPSPSLAATPHLCNPKDYKVLMKIKKSLNNPHRLASWVPNTDCCDWNSVHCHPTTNRVSRLSIISGNISGQIPSSVADLPHLILLGFEKLTNITGSIPSSIVKLKNLATLQLDGNLLSGPIPDFLSQISSLTTLDLSFNQFSGSIPSSLSNLNNLQSLHLDGNKLTGSIPELFSKYNGSNRPNLYLPRNQLSGPIPKSFGDIAFEMIDLSRNKLEGDGSMLFNPKRATDWIDLSRNLLDFDLTNVMFPVTLNYLDLSHNMIRGKIPEQIKDLDYLYSQGLNVSYNRLCGQIPSGGKFPKFDYTTYFHNKCLCGTPLPACKGKSDELSVNVPAA